MSNLPVTSAQHSSSVSASLKAAGEEDTCPAPPVTPAEASSVACAKRPVGLERADKAMSSSRLERRSSEDCDWCEPEADAEPCCCGTGAPSGNHCCRSTTAEVPLDCGVLTYPLDHIAPW